MTWEDQKQSVRNAVEKVLKAGDNEFTQELSFIVHLKPGLIPQIIYRVDDLIGFEGIK